MECLFPSGHTRGLTHACKQKRNAVLSVVEFSQFSKIRSHLSLRWRSTQIMAIRKGSRNAAHLIKIPIV